MKKGMRRLVLAKETVSKLSTLQGVQGGAELTYHCTQTCNSYCVSGCVFMCYDPR